MERKIVGPLKSLFSISPPCVVAVGEELTGVESVYPIVFALCSNEGPV